MRLRKLFTGLLMAACIFSFSIGQVLATDPLTPKREYQTASLGTPGQNIVTVEWEAKFTAFGSIEDAPANVIMGLTGSAQKPTGPSQIPIILRFNGTKDFKLIDARDGAAYDKMTNIEFDLNTVYKFKVTVYLATKTYDAWVNGVQLASKFKFRTNTPEINDIGTFVYNDQEEPNGSKVTITNLSAPGLKAVAPEASTPEPSASVPAPEAPAVSTPPTPASSNPKTEDAGIVSYILLVATTGTAAITLFKRKK